MTGPRLEAHNRMPARLIAVLLAYTAYRVVEPQSLVLGVVIGAALLMLLWWGIDRLVERP